MQLWALVFPASESAPGSRRPPDLCPRKVSSKSMDDSLSMPLTLDSFFKRKDEPQDRAAPVSEPAPVPVSKPAPAAAKPTTKSPEQPEKPAEAAGKSPKTTSSADEQEFIDFFLKVASAPFFKGNPLKARRVAVFGKKYYWGNEVTHGIEKLPL